MDCLNCIENYKCCKNIAVTLGLEERNKFKHKKLVALLENDKFLGYVYILKQKKDGSCIYFNNKTNLCDVYENRPEVCKNYSCN